MYAYCKGADCTVRGPIGTNTMCDLLCVIFSRCCVCWWCGGRFLGYCTVCLLA